MKQRLIRAGIILGVLATLAIPGYVLLRKWLSGSSVGTIHIDTPTAKKQGTALETPEPITLDTPYFSTSLPSTFMIKRQTTLTNGGPILYELSANTNGRTDEQFGATVGTLPTDGLPGISDYALHTTDVTTYAKYSPDNLPADAVAFQTISGPAAITVFWPRGERYIELSFSTDGAASLNSLESVWNSVNSSWHWK